MPGSLAGDSPATNSALFSGAVLSPEAKAKLGLFNPVVLERRRLASCRIRCENSVPLPAIKCPTGDLLLNECGLSKTEKTNYCP